MQKNLNNTGINRDRSVPASGPEAKRKGGVPSEIVEELRQGNHAAFELVYRLYQADVKRFLLSLARDNELAEDVMQEAFLYLWEKREQLDPSKNISNYLFHVVRSMLISRLRRQQVANRYLRELPPEEEMLYAADDSMIAEETEILVSIVVSQMPKQRRKIYELSRYEGLSNREIAEQLGIDTRNVRTQLHYATKEIKDVLGLFLLFFIL